MTSTKLYQTLENRENPDKIEREGPFKCKWENSWLGQGYYFWDSFLEIAHWWGKMRYNDNHIICEADCEINSENCLDLVGNTTHLRKFSGAVSAMKSLNMVNDKTTVSRVLMYIRDTLKTFTYEAVRVYGINTISPDNYLEYTNRLIFEVGKGQYLDGLPAIQICIYKGTGLGLKNYRVIYPPEFDNGYVI